MKKLPSHILKINRIESNDVSNVINFQRRRILVEEFNKARDELKRAFNLFTPSPASVYKPTHGGYPG